MNLSRRFFILNILALMCALLLTALAAAVCAAVCTKLFNSDADMVQLKRIYEARAGFAEIKREAGTRNADEILGAGYQQVLHAAVKAIGAEALIIRNREVVFSTGHFKRIDIEKALTTSNGIPGTDTVELGEKLYIFDRVDLKYKNGDSGILILLAPVKAQTSMYFFLGIFIAAFFMLAYMGMSLWISASFSRRVIAPIVRLNAAAARISEGVLSHEIAEEGEAEVRALCRTLEQMRIRLKESVYLQEKYDENRKFLISSISHDLKTPVTSIIGYIDGILDGIANTPEKTGSYLETARTKALLVNTMIDDLLLYSRLDLNQLPFNFEKTDLVQYFEYCIEDNRNEFEKAGIKLTLQNELNQAVFVLIDKERLKRVVQNILDNSKKYMVGLHGHVVIMLRETRTSAIIEIKDNGRGIPEKDLPYIFDRFYRADASRSSTDGSGLGLAIAKQIVEGHEGKIWAISREPQGTSIIMSLKKY